MAYPPVGFFDPLQDPSFPIHRLSPMSLDGRPVRLRGSVSVPIVPAPTSAIAAPLSEPCAVRHRVREYASLRCPPHRRDPARFELEHSKRRDRGPTCIAGKPHAHQAGRPLRPSRGACRVDVAIAFDWPERCHGPRPEGHGARASRLIAALRVDREGPTRSSWKDEPVWNPFFAARGPDGRRRLSVSPWGVSVREEGARLEEVCPERKLCHVPCVVVAVAGADAVFVSVPRLPATGARRGVHSRSSWGF